ncbi:DUF808 domain-containing protein [Nitratifractor sp.]
MTGGFFAVLDDIAALLDDTASMTKVAAKQVGGVLGDDLAVNAEQASGFRADRELPVLWAITKGSFVNKLILVPLALLLSAFAPWAIAPILLLGGAYLAFEGAEKIYEALFPHGDEEEQPTNETDEKAKVSSAIRTDFILSIEIVVIALGTVADEPLLTRIVVVSIVAILATIGVYGLVALMVRLDDMGLALLRRYDRREGALAKVLRTTGRWMVAAMPKLIRALSYIGTFAMLMVAGGIYLHNLHALEEIFAPLPALLADLVMGLALGGVIFVPVETLLHIRKTLRSKKES